MIQFHLENRIEKLLPFETEIDQLGTLNKSQLRMFAPHIKERGNPSLK